MHCLFGVVYVNLDCFGSSRRPPQYAIGAAIVEWAWPKLANLPRSRPMALDSI